MLWSPQIEMLYLHCGWERTGTTSLQAAFAECSGRLAEAGIVYPARWLRSEFRDRSERLSRGEPLAAHAFDDLRAMLERHSEEDVLLSAEAITNWLETEPKRGALLQLLESAAGAMPVKLIWTLRRFDEQMQSLYLLALRVGAPVPADPHDARDPAVVFGGMRLLDELAATENAYVKYAPSGAHNLEILGALGLPAEVEVALRESLGRQRRRNVSPGAKQIAAIVDADALAARAGVDVDREAIRRAVHGGDLRFDDDRPGQLFGIAVRRALCERALAAAREVRFAPYADFFARAEVGGSRDPSVSQEILTDADLQRVVAQLESTVDA